MKMQNDLKVSSFDNLESSSEWSGKCLKCLDDYLTGNQLRGQGVKCHESFGQRVQNADKVCGRHRQRIKRAGGFQSCRRYRLAVVLAVKELGDHVPALLHAHGDTACLRGTADISYQSKPLRPSSCSTSPKFGFIRWMSKLSNRAVATGIATFA